jgi:tetratricopeptide (TPR) repeat protein
MSMTARASVFAFTTSFLLSYTLLGQAPSTDQALQLHSRQAQEYLQENRPDKAIDEFRAILAARPNELAVRANLGTLLYFQGDYKDAAVELRTVANAQPNLWKIVTLLGMCEKRIGNLPGARSALETAFPKLTDEKIRVQAGLELVELYYASRDLDKATEIVSALRKVKPDDPAILYTAHRLYAEQADEAALALLIAAPKSAWMQQILGEEMMTQGNTDAAILHYRAALALDDRLAGLHYELGEVLSASSSESDKEQSEKEYEKAVTQNPFDQKAECRLGKIALARSDLSAAFAHYSTAARLQPEDSEANLGLGKVLIAMKEPEKARPFLEKAVQLDPSDATAYYQLGTLYRRIGRTDDAQREFDQFQRLKKTKEDLKDFYKAMRLQNRPDEDSDGTTDVATAP